MNTTVRFISCTVVFMCDVLTGEARKAEAQCGPGNTNRKGQGMNRQSMFGPRSFRDGRVQVYGCSPGCLLVSLLVSVILTIILNVVLNLF